MSTTILAEEFSTRRLGTDRDGGPLTLMDVDSPGLRYDAILCVRLFGWESLTLWRSPYDGVVRPKYRDENWQYSAEYRAYVASTRPVAEEPRS